MERLGALNTPYDTVSITLPKGDTPRACTMYTPRGWYYLNGLTIYTKGCSMWSKRVNIPSRPLDRGPRPDIQDIHPSRDMLRG